MDVFPATVFLLCSGTSLLCFVLILRAYVRSRDRMLLWSSACFALLTINNALLFLDIVVFPEADLQIWRSAVTLTALSLLLFGFIWEAE